MKWAFCFLCASSRRLVADIDVVVDDANSTSVSEAFLVDVDQAMNTLVCHDSLRSLVLVDVLEGALCKELRTMRNFKQVATLLAVLQALLASLCHPL